jgi:hypothetical protein
LGARHGFGGSCYNHTARARPASRTIDVHRLDLARVSSRRLAVIMPSKKPAPKFPKEKITGMPDWWTLLYRTGSMENVPAESDLEQQRINRETEAVIDARLDILADHLSIRRGDWKALAEAIAVNYVDDFPVATSVASRGRFAKSDRFATVAMVELCMLKNADVDGKEIGVKEATRLLAAELKIGQADALETKYHKCVRELEGHPKTLGTLSRWRSFRPALLLDPEQRATIDDDLSRTEKECFPVRVKK